MNVNSKVTDSVIKSIMEGTDPRAAIDAALDEKSGYHKEKRIRGGKPTIVNVKNTKRKVHHTLTPDQKKAIKKAHSAAANKKRAKSIKKGEKVGLYQGREIKGTINMESVNIVSEEEEAKVFAIACPACRDGQLEFFVDPETGEEDTTVLVCPDCGETFMVVPTAEIEADDDDEDDDDDDKTEDKAEDNEAAAEDEVAAENEVASEDEAAEDAELADAAETVAPTDESAKHGSCEEEHPEENSGLFFAAE